MVPVFPIEPGIEWRASVQLSTRARNWLALRRVKVAAGEVSTASGDHLDHGDDEASSDVGVDDPADDAVGEHVLYGTDVDVAFGVRLAGEIREPDVVRRVRVELASSSSS